MNTITNPFKKKIYCGYCNGGMKRKVERGKPKFTCTLHSSDSTKCSRKALVEESTMTCLIFKRYGEISNQEIHDMIDHVVIFDKLLFEIHFKEDEPVIFSTNFIQY